MGGVTGELLFYGGLAAMGMSFLFAAAAGLTFWIRAKRLKQRFDQEYGKVQK